MEVFGFHECSHKLHDNKLKDTLDGAIAQLGERLPCTQEVSSSILLSSTIYLLTSLLNDSCNKLHVIIKCLVIK